MARDIRAHHSKTSPWLVNVAAIRRTPDRRRREVRRGQLSGLHLTASAVPAGAEVVVDLTLELVDGGIVAAGTVTAPWAGECRRCLAAVEGEVRVPVRELYRSREGPSGAAAGHRADDEETYWLVGDELDLSNLARDAVLLELPQAPLCRPGCAGLCPTCGADLNPGPCGCRPDSADPPWAALDGLRRRGPS